MVMKGFKAFGKGMVCKGKQYVENTVFEEDKAEICNCGMHFCENPFDVLDYYDLVNSDGDFCDFAEVESLAKEYTDDNKKFCTTKLKVGAKLSFEGFIKACIDFVFEKTVRNTTSYKINSKDYTVISSSKDSAQIGSSGDSAKIGSSGDSAKIGSSGNFAKIGSSGVSAQIGSSGDFAKIGSSGNFAKIGSSGKHAVICCAGNNSMAKAKTGSWITLSEWRFDGKENENIPICVKTEFVDGKIIKEDTFYKLKNGKFVEVSIEGE